MNKIRGFELVDKYKKVGEALLPRRTTLHAAGYDFFAAEDKTVPSIKETLTTTLVSTGVKAYMPKNEFLMLVNRSSSPRKRKLILPNGVGIIDSDYYNNEKNEGEIFLQLINFADEAYDVKQGDRICQGIFMPYLLVDEDIQPDKQRLGGFGSSGQ